VPTFFLLATGINTGFLFNVLRNPVIKTAQVGLEVAHGILAGAGARNVVSDTWYRDLLVPPGRPPQHVLQTIWFAIYIVMCCGCALAVRRHESAVSYAVRDTIQNGLWWYYTQLAVSVSGYLRFFKAKGPLAASVNAIALTGSVLVMTKRFHDGTDGATTPFLVPYCAWLCVVVYINGGIYWLNRRRGVVPPALDRVTVLGRNPASNSEAEGKEKVDCP